MANSSLSSVARPGAGNFGSLSPLVQSYDEWTASSQAAMLPRDNGLYTGGAFSPLQPTRPVGIDRGWDGDPNSRPMPRRWQYPVGWNLPVGQPGTEGLKITSFATLRAFADMYSIVRSVIDQCIGEIIATNWDIIPTKTAELAMYGDEKAQEDFARRREQAMQFWARPDQRYRDWQGWMHAILEDYFVLDAMSLYLHPSRLKGHGPFNTNWSSLDVIDGSCYAADTEVLTRAGWKRFTDVNIATDEFATRNQKTKAFEWQQAMYFHEADHDGEMYAFSSRSLDLLVTPNHRMLVSSVPRRYQHVDRWHGEGGETFLRADELARTYSGRTALPLVSTWTAPDLTVFRFPRVARRPGKKPFEAMSGDDFAAFMGMWLAEGCVAWHGAPKRPSIYVTQKESSKGFLPFKELLTRLLGREPAYNGSNFYFRHAELAEYLRQFGHALDKFVPDEIKNMSRRQLEIFWEYYRLGDGHTEPSGRQGIVTSSRRMADDLQEIAQKMGYSASVSVRRTKHDVVIQGRVVKAEKCRPNYTIRLRSSREQHFSATQTTYTGKVYCVSVPNEVLYVRRNGKPVWCGNTIRPLLDVRGGTPAAPNPAYEQYLWGVPRVDLMTPLDQQDRENTTIVKADEFKGDQLLYLPHEVRDWTPYGFSHLERALVPVVTGFRRQIYALQYYDQGTLPAVYVTPGPDISTPQQIAMLQRALNNIAGDQAWKHKVIVLPPGSKVDPQKTVNLADQFDQVLAAAVTMVFAKTPMDIGMTPRVAAVQSPSETKEFSQINSENADKRGLKPRLAFLKHSLFDYVMQTLWGQKDMEWHWPGLDTAEDQLSKLQYWSGLVKAGIASIDQAAQALGLQPWGLPETQLPGLQTAQGWVPLTGAVDGGEQTDELLASGAGEEVPADEVPNEIKRKHAQKGKPGERISGSSSPAHRVAARQQGTHPQASRQQPGTHRPISNVLGGSVHDGGVRGKAAYAELDALARHIRKGRDASTWVAKALDDVTVGIFTEVPELEKAVDVARVIVATKDYLTRRFGALSDVIRMIAKRLGQLIYEWRTGKLSMPTLIDAFVQALRGGYLVALNSGAAGAAVDHDDTPLPDFHAEAEEMGETQRDFAINLVHDLTNGLSAQALEARLALYGETLVGAYNMGYGETVRKAHPGYQMIWRLGDDSDHCDLCLPRAGQVVTWNSLPGWPGTGGFGGPVCEGGPRCHCWIEFVSATGKSVNTPMYSVTHNPLGVEGLWHSKTLQLPAYIQQVARGIMESGYSRAEAIPMAVNAIKRWARGADHVHPEVIAASQKALAEWEKLRALPDKKDL